MKNESNDSACIYAEVKYCGKKFELFYPTEDISLTNKSRWEKVLVRKMTEWKIEKTYHEPIILASEVLMPVTILLIAGFFLAPRK